MLWYIMANILFQVYNSILNKSLYSGRTEEENNYRHKVRYEIVPKLVIELFKSVN